MSIDEELMKDDFLQIFGEHNNLKDDEHNILAKKNAQLTGRWAQQFVGVRRNLTYPMTNNEHTQQFERGLHHRCVESRQSQIMAISI